MWICREGDYYRYGAEISESSNDKREMYKSKAQQAYSKAQDACQGEGKLASTNPIWLGLALNFSVFYYEICEETEKAKELAKVKLEIHFSSACLTKLLDPSLLLTHISVSGSQSAFDRALEELDELPEDQYKDSTLIMQLLKDNLTLWNETDEDGNIEIVDMES